MENSIDYEVATGRADFDFLVKSVEALADADIPPQAAEEANVFYCPSLWFTPDGRETPRQGPHSSIAILGHTRTAVPCVKSVADNVGLTLRWSRDLATALVDVSATVDEWMCCVIVIDDFGSVSAIFDLVYSFRQRCPQVPVIIASATFSRDDLSAERLPLCDASVRMPCTDGRFATALALAVRNNASWQKRVSDLDLDLLRL